MKALLYKELKLAMHPVCYIFLFLFPFMILIPSYPIGVGFIYLLASYPILFLGANKGQQSNDLLFSTLLPVRKKDIVLARIITVVSMQARIITVVSMQAVFIALMSILSPVSGLVQVNIADESGSGPSIPGLGLDAYVSVVAFAVIGLALADLIFFSIYYERGKSIVASTLLSIIAFMAFIGASTLVLPYAVPGYMDFFSGKLGVQFAALGVALLLSFLIHFASYKISSGQLERVDF